LLELLLSHGCISPSYNLQVTGGRDEKEESVMPAPEITVLFFSFAADRMNCRERQYPLEKPCSVAEFFDRHLRDSLRDPLPAWLFSVNQEWAPPDYVLHSGDEVAVVPPVSGG
jgi:molybdopterin converting factor small subunit